MLDLSQRIKLLVGELSLANLGLQVQVEDLNTQLVSARAELAECHRQRVNEFTRDPSKE